MSGVADHEAAAGGEEGGHDSGGENARLRFFGELGIAASLLDQRAATYSIDTRQRLGLAIAAARGAKALLLDEPTSLMDADTAEHFTTLVKAYAEGIITGEPAAVLMTTDSPELAAEFSHKVGLLKKGKLLGVLVADDMTRPELLEQCLQHCAEPVRRG